MQLDRTFVAVRERSRSELLDLTLLVCRRYWLGLWTMAAPAVASFTLLNIWLFLTWFGPDGTSWLDHGTLMSLRWRYFFSVGMLVYVEAPLALVGVTAFLGKAMFVERPSFRSLLGELWETSNTLLYYQGLWRMSLVLPVVASVTLLVVDPADLPGLWWYGWMIFGISFVVRSARPYLIEMIVLERAVPKAHGRDVVSIGTRSRQLARADDDWFARAMTDRLVGVVLLIMAVGTLEFVLSPGTLLAIPGGGILWLIGSQLGFWLVAIFMTAYRFLSYLDLRIRHEGWEVELLLRAEAARWELAP